MLAKRVSGLLVVCGMLLAGLAPAGARSSTAGVTFGPPDWAFESNQAYANLGQSAVIAGDLNGDGYDDVVTGAWHYDNQGYVDAGRAYVFYGSAEGLGTTPQILEPPVLEANAFFGFPLSPIGDVNGDGYDDLLISMDNYDYAYSDEGAVYAYYGSASGLGSSPSWMARGDATYAHLGWDLAAAGDVNGDGYDDVIAGAYRYDYNDVSHAYVWYGSATGLDANGTRPVGLPSNADWYAAAPQYNENGFAFGSQVGPAGDVNGDGYDDVFVGASLYDHPEVDEGAVFVWYGSATGLGAPGNLGNYDWMAESNQAGAQWTAGARGTQAPGDYNGDGYDDFALGSYVYDNPETNEGMVFVWYGSSTGLGANGTPSNAGWTAQSDQASGTLGYSIGCPGDVNGDGFDDLLAGGYGLEYNPGSGDNVGKLLVWYGSRSGLGEPGTLANADRTYVGNPSQYYFGMEAGTAGDVNGGFPDVVAGAPYYSNGEAAEGMAVVYYTTGTTYLPLVLRSAP